MFCPNCGANNADTATLCVQCSQPIQQFSTAPQTLQPSPAGMPVPGQPGSVAAARPQVPNYQTQSIIAIVASVLCCTLLSLPFAIIALVNSNQVNTKLAVNDIAGALAASKNAKMFSWIS